MGDAGPTDDDTEYDESTSTDAEQPEDERTGDQNGDTTPEETGTEQSSGAVDESSHGPTANQTGGSATEETGNTSQTTSRAQREREVVTRDELKDLEETLDEFEDEIEGRTVHREELEADLKQYVRTRVRRGHATGWGPYLVLLYGTVMTLGAFYFLGGGWAVLAMLVVWLSTLGLYTLMILVGVTVKAVGLPGRAIGKLRNLR
jgi:Flp pilus assembly protein TadB